MIISLITIFNIDWKMIPVDDLHKEGGETLLNRLGIILTALILSFSFIPHAFAASQGSVELKKAEVFIDQAILEAQQGKLDQSQQTYEQFRKAWFTFEDQIKGESIQAYGDVESNMGQVDYAFLQKKQTNVIQALQGLKQVNEKFINGQYKAGGESLNTNFSLSDFITLLQQTKEDANAHLQQKSLQDIAKVRQMWLSVEGSVVAQSATVYDDTERDMVVVNAQLSANPPQYQEATQLVDKMIQYLTPLAGKSGYTMWDAAMIPIREGLEALLVVAALLAFVKKSENERKGRAWIWAGVSAGLGVSVIIALIVKFIFSSGAFGNNNFLIAGWTGVIAAVMLLYMSYWLHSQSSIADWNQYLRKKSQSAVNTGRLVSFGVLAFLAIFREGTETVLFLVGMVNQISLSDLLLGLGIGFAILSILAYLMLVIGMKLPLRPFFVVSSLIIFYLCIKFTGMGIHSLQLAGTLPSTQVDWLPSIDFLALYPSWQSTIPQITLLVAALFVVMWKKGWFKGSNS